MYWQSIPESWTGGGEGMIAKPRHKLVWMIKHVLNCLLSELMAVSSGNELAK